MSRQPERNLALELVRVTEAAAISAAPWMGRGDKEGVDRAAVDAMRSALSVVNMDGLVVIGEGEKDQAPMLYNGERVGDGTPPLCDVAVDPIDGTSLVAAGRGGALSVIAVSSRESMFDPGACVYMDKIAVGPACKGAIDIRVSTTENLHRVAEAKGEKISDLTTVVLYRPRHEQLIEEIRSTGARIRLIPDGDIAGAISTAWPESDSDVLFGIGGTPEGVVSAAALKCMGGEIQGKLWPRNDAERALAEAAGYDLDAVLTNEDLVSGNNCFFAATGVTGGDLLRGVQFHAGGVSTHSLVMRSRSGTVRQIQTRHRQFELKSSPQL